MKIQNVVCAAVAAALLLCLGAQAGESSKKPANYPVRPVQMMVSNAAGDGTDIMVRALIAEMDLGRPITVVNRGGASGTIGTTEGAKAAPNGYMVTVGAPAPFYIRPHIDNLSYDIGDFRHIVQISPEEPLVLAVTPSSPYKTFQDIEAAWKRGEALKFSSANPGSVGHCAMMDLFKQMGVTGGVNVPAMGGGGAMNDLIGGHTAFMPADLADVIPRMKNGQVVPLAVFGDQRNHMLPDVPSMKELGYDGTSYVVAFKWLSVPKGTPDDIVEYLQEQFNKAVMSEKYAAFINMLNGQPTYVESEEKLTAKLNSIYAKYGEIVEMIGMSKNAKK